MKRREAIKYAAFFCGSILTVTGISVMPVACVPTNRAKETELNDDDEKLIGELAATLIPETDVPGAEVVNVGPFVVMMLQDCYTMEQRTEFKNGLEILKEQSELRFKRPFGGLDAATKEKLLKEQEKDASQFMQLLKRLVNMGYYTSEIGSKQALRYVFVPGSYKSCVMLEPGEKAWAM